MKTFLIDIRKLFIFGIKGLCHFVKFKSLSLLSFELIRDLEYYKFSNKETCHLFTRVNFSRLNTLEDRFKWAIFFQIIEDNTIGDFWRYVLKASLIFFK